MIEPPHGPTLTEFADRMLTARLEDPNMSPSGERMTQIIILLEMIGVESEPAFDTDGFMSGLQIGDDLLHIS